MLILNSPQLIAEYHVLHRLLLPRHSPNALFALDLIQKKTGSPVNPGWGHSLAQSITIPLRPLVQLPEHLVSLLDLDCVLHSGIEPQVDRRESRIAIQNTVILYAWD